MKQKIKIDRFLRPEQNKVVQSMKRNVSFFRNSFRLKRRKGKVFFDVRNSGTLERSDFVPRRRGRSRRNEFFLERRASIVEFASWKNSLVSNRQKDEKLLRFDFFSTQKKEKLWFCSIFQADRVQFEKDCLHVEATLDEFLDWNENRTLSNENPFKLISNETFFAYGDYIHLAELLNESDERLFKVEKEFSIARTLRFSSLLFVRFDHEKLIDWSDIGLNERDGNQSTLWIGSQGSHTPCHYDTYGINFVAQIVGK